MPNDPTTTAPPQAVLLSNGRYHSLVRASGSGFCALEGLFLTRWRGDPVDDAEGWFLYVQDMDSGALWSATRQPVGGAQGCCDVDLGPGRAEFRRREQGIGLVLEVCVAPGMDVEFRRLRLSNEGPHRRRLRVVSCLEVALDSRAAFVAHPVFSSLFVTTGHLPGARALLASRRARSATERPWSMIHWLVGPPGQRYGLETDRARLLGRCGGLHAPRALVEGRALSGTTGNVLDPVLALELGMTLGPGESLGLGLGLGASRAPRVLEDWALRHQGLADLDPVFAAAGLRAAARPGANEDLQARVAALAGEAALMPVLCPRTAPADEPQGPAGPGRAQAPASEAPALPGPLLFDNGRGGFSLDGREYVIRVHPARSGYPPLPWCNVIANEGFGFLVSESGAGTTWSLNSREHRISPWFNDPLTDPHGEALYVQDRDSGRLWSPTPGPVPDPGAYEVRHGLGYTRFRHHCSGLDEEVVQYCARHDPVKIVRLHLRNTGERPRRLGLVCYLQLVMGSDPQTHGRQVLTEQDRGILLARRTGPGEFAGRTAFLRVLGARAGMAVDFTTDRAAFLGAGGRVGRPAALMGGGGLDGRTGPLPCACFALRVRFDLAPGEDLRCAFVLGEAADRGQSLSLAGRYRDMAAVDRALDAVGGYWERTLDGLRIRTPDPALDLMVNAWLPYQDLSCRLWGRSALYQSGGAYGFRDQLQDAAALLYLDPALTRAQILRHAAHQFVEGDVLHWWHPPQGRGIRTRFSDDLLWLPYVTGVYLERCADPGLLDTSVPYLRARALEPGEDEAFLSPEDSGRPGTLYEHCCLAIDRSLATGAHGLPLMGTGDWNDGMNRVGRQGRGESVWLGFFLYHILGRFAPRCAARGDTDRARRYTRHRERLHAALNGPGWDGQWYRRAFYDDGTPLGSAANRECRIDAIAQAWAVISGAAPRARAEQALDAVERHLIDEQAGIIRLLTPPFDRTRHDPGYIKGYVPGVRENGGQYTHGVLWLVRAFAELGRHDRAMALISLLNPVNHARDPGGVERYKVEPYVVAADVYGVSPHTGRGGWSWYTGSAGWMYRIVLESLLGLRLEGGRALVLRPRIPGHWPGFSMDYRPPGGATRYHIVVDNSGREHAVLRSAELDGAGLELSAGAVRVPLADDGQVHQVHQVHLVMGDAASPPAPT